MTRLRAFTLLEVLISMVLASIVIVAVGAVVSMAFERTANYSKMNDRVYSMASLHSTMLADVQTAVDIKNEGGDIVCTMDDRVVTYALKPAYVLRTIDQRADTFSIRISKLVTSLNGVEAIGDGLVDKIRMTVQAGGGEDKTMSMIIEKVYGADNLMQSSNHQITKSSNQ